MRKESCNEITDERNLRWWPGAESNCRHEDFQSTALPTELPGHIYINELLVLCIRHENQDFLSAFLPCCFATPLHRPYFENGQTVFLDRI